MLNFLKIVITTWTFAFRYIQDKNQAASILTVAHGAPPRLSPQCRGTSPGPGAAGRGGSPVLSQAKTASGPALG